MNRMERILRTALDEDIGSGDITTENIVDTALFASGVIRVKEHAIIAGIGIAEQVFKIVDPDIKFTSTVSDGDHVRRDQTIAEVTGRASSLLKAERTALNFLMRLSGIATLTHAYVKAVERTGVTLLDTRKTSPCLRVPEKLAVKAGGGTNHRFGLFDGILIKDNHIKAAGSIKNAVKKVQRTMPYHKVEVEVKNIEELREAVNAGADIVMLDNMGLKMLRRCISMARGRALTEVSGNITLGNIQEVARLKPDFISTGAITHSASAIDISMKLINIYPKT